MLNTYTDFIWPSHENSFIGYVPDNGHAKSIISNYYIIIIIIVILSDI